MAGEGEAVVVDLQDEMFGHLVFVGDPADAKWSSPFQPDRLRMGVVRPGMESDVRTGAEFEGESETVF